MNSVLRWAVGGCAVLWCAGAAGAADASAPVPLGTLEPFWRYSAALGPFHEKGQQLVVVPDFMSRGDFPYRKRPFAKEAMFADHLSIVRLLGGFNDGDDQSAANSTLHARDLAWRDADGTIRFRMELLRPRLQPYLDCGYSNLTLVLDNVPWCFPAKPGCGSRLGQSSPPRDTNEWHAFIQALCVEVKNIMGPEAAQYLRFRVGTENNGRARFDGTQAQFLRHYESASSAVQAVLPGAQFGPFNISGISVHGLDQENVNAYALAQYCAEKKLPFDWVAFSRYYRPGTDPEEYAQTCRDVWDEFAQRVPALKGVSREIHEFGFAPWGEVQKGAFASNEPGALGAALTCQIMWRLRAAGINRLWHWGVDDRFRDRHNQLETYVTSQAWLLSVLERMAGGDAYLFPPREKAAHGTKILVAGSFRKAGALLMLSAYNTDIAQHNPETVSFQIPAGLLPAGAQTARFVRLTTGNAPYDVLRRDLAKAGLLKPEYLSRPDRLGDIREMGAGRPAEMFVGNHLDEYKQQWVDSLTLKPLTPDIGQLGSETGGTTIRVHLTVPEVLVLEVRNARGSP